MLDDKEWGMVLRLGLMPGRMMLTIGLVLASGVLGVGSEAQEQHDRGQNVQPAFEGWERNADGSFNMVFGYLNRNYAEEPYVQIGPNNQFQTEPADRGQPTHFYPRRQMYVFKVPVPADWGKKELVWTVTHNGRTDKAVGWLAPFYELDTSVYRAQRSAQSGRASTEDERRDKAPSIVVEGRDTVTTLLTAPVSLSVTVEDDGLPGPGKGRAFTEDGGEETSRDRVNATRQDKVNIYSAQKTGLAVTWLHYRGPATVTFDPMVSPLAKTGGRATTTAHFSLPGTYVIRGVADDQIFTTPVNFTVIVQPTGAR